MGKAQLTVKETKEMFIYVSNKIMESKDVLTQADKAIGDGDHGQHLGSHDVRALMASSTRAGISPRVVELYFADNREDHVVFGGCINRGRGSRNDRERDGERNEDVFHEGVSPS